MSWPQPHRLPQLDRSSYRSPCSNQRGYVSRCSPPATSRAALAHSNYSPCTGQQHALEGRLAHSPILRQVLAFTDSDVKLHVHQCKQMRWGRVSECVGRTRYNFIVDLEFDRPQYEVHFTCIHTRTHAAITQRGWTTRLCPTGPGSDGCLPAMWSEPIQ
jgi:hypothetical protein